MNKESFKELSPQEQHDWLQERSDAGATVDEICEEIDIPRRSLQVLGHVCAKGNWILNITSSSCGVKRYSED